MSRSRQTPARGRGGVNRANEWVFKPVLPPRSIVLSGIGTPPPAKAAKRGYSGVDNRAWFYRVGRRYFRRRSRAAVDVFSDAASTAFGARAPCLSLGFASNESDPVRLGAK